MKSNDDGDTIKTPTRGALKSRSPMRKHMKSSSKDSNQKKQVKFCLSDEYYLRERRAKKKSY